MGRMANIIYRVLDEGDSEAVEKCVIDHFISEEPLSICVGLRPTEHFPRLMVKNTLWQKASIGAFDEETGYLCGIRVNHLMKNDDLLPEFDDGSRYTPEHKKILRLIQKCKETSPTKIHCNDNSMEHIFVAVDKRYSRRGIASELYKRSAALAKENGCREMYAFCTSHYSKRSATNAGYEKMNELYYKDYVDEVSGEKVFASVPDPHISVSMM